MKRYFILAGVEHEGNSGRYAIADNCFDIEEDVDGLFLTCPDGERIDLSNLEFEDKLKIVANLEELKVKDMEEWEVI